MPAQRDRRSRVRAFGVAVLWRFGNGLQTCTNVVYRAMDAVDDVDRLPRCPDCQIGPDVGDDCPVCRDHREEQEREKEIAHGGYEQGFDQGYEAGLKKVAW